MKRNQRISGGVAALGAVALVLSGCTSPPSSTTSAGSAGTWNSPTGSLKGTSLRIWSSQSTVTIARSVVNAFDKSTGANVTVTVVPDTYESNVSTKLATGDTPDLMLWGATQAGLAQVQAATKLQVLDGAPWLSKLKPQYKGLGAQNGKQYAALFSAPDNIGIYYNKANFKRAGITKVPTNFTEYLAAANKLKQAGVAAPIFEAGGDQWPVQDDVLCQFSDLAAGGFWTKLNENKASFTDPAVVALIKQYDSIFTSGLANANYKTATFVNQADALMSGQAGMEYQFGALVTQMLASHPVSELNAKIGYFPLGHSSSVATYALGVSNTAVAFKTGNAKKEAASRQFLEYLMGPYYPSFIKSQSFVSLETGVPTPKNIPQVTLDASNVPEHIGSMQQQAIANPDLYLNLSDMLQGTKTPQQVAQDTQSQFRQLATAKGAPGF